jgi:hypothetical protein
VGPPSRRKTRAQRSLLSDMVALVVGVLCRSIVFLSNNNLGSLISLNSQLLLQIFDGHIFQHGNPYTDFTVSRSCMHPYLGLRKIII